MFWIILFVVVILIIGVLAKDPNKMPDGLSEAEQEEWRLKQRAKEIRSKERMDFISYGHLKHEVICPHCQVRGEVRMRSKQAKKGISGGKAVGAIVTGGVSIIATGISRHEKETEAHCGNCHTSWRI